MRRGSRLRTYAMRLALLASVTRRESEDAAKSRFPPAELPQSMRYDFGFREEDPAGVEVAYWMC
jgi:hypothetical protein